MKQHSTCSRFQQKSHKGVSSIPCSIYFTADTFFTRQHTDDTIILASHEDSVTASTLLQNHLNLLEPWLHKWRIKINEAKSTQVNFSFRTGCCPPVSLHNETVLDSTSMRYLGTHLDSKLGQKHHVVQKRKQVDSKTKELYWLIGRKSHLSLENNVLFYKTIFKPIRPYGKQLQGMCQ